MVERNNTIVYKISPAPEISVSILIFQICMPLKDYQTALSFDFAYNFVLDEDRTFDNEAGASTAGILSGEFKDGYVHILGINVSYKF